MAVPSEAARHLLGVAVVVIWGLNFVAGKIGLAQIPPLLLMTLRFSLVGDSALSLP